MPLVFQAFNWGPRGLPRRESRIGDDGGGDGRDREDPSRPFAMLPFCGYNMGGYFAHWLEMRKLIPSCRASST